MELCEENDYTQERLTRKDADPHHEEANHGMQHFEPKGKVQHRQQSKS